MADVPNRTALDRSDFGAWVRSWGWSEISRVYRMAMHPACLLPALIALVGVIGWGKLLDVVWEYGKWGVHPDAIARYQEGISTAAYAELDAEGVFERWWDHQLACLNRAALAACHGKLMGGTQPLGPGVTPYEQTLRTGGVVPAVGQMISGVRWMVTQRLGFAILLFAGVLFVTAACGGVIVRQAAMTVARGEQPTFHQAIQFTKARYLNGFLAAPILPLALSLFCLGVPFVIGIVLAIPVLDFFAGLFFFAALLFGFAAAFFGLGGLVCGSLFWPAIAVEGCDAFEAMSRAYHYVLDRPWRTLVYALVLAVCGALSWMVVRIIARVGLWAAFAAAAWWLGEYTPFRQGYGDLGDLLTAPTMTAVLPSNLPAEGWTEAPTAFFMRLWVMLVLGVVWAFPWTFYLCGSTVVFFLLRREVDSVDLEEVYGEDYEETMPPAPQTAPGPLVKAEETGLPILPP